MITKCFNRSSPGHGVAEYGILSVLLLVGSIGMLSLMGTDIDGLFKSFHISPAQLRTSAGAPQTLAATGNNNAALTAAANSAAGFNPSGLPRGVGQEQVCFRNNLCTSMLSIAGGSTDTSGGNGTQLVLGSVDSINQLIQKLKQDPNSDSSLIGLLTQLANNGHDIGNTISVPVNTDPSNDNRGSVGAQIVSQIETLNTSKFALVDYVNAHPKSLDPVVKEFVTAQADNIQAIGRSRTDLAGCTGGECGPVGEVYFKDGGSADLVHQDANSICKSGGNQNKCIQ